MYVDRLLASPRPVRAGYKPSCALWEGVVTARKALIAAAVTFMTPARFSAIPSSALAQQMQLLVVFFAFLAALSLQAVYRPHASDLLHRLEFLSLAGSLLTCYFGIFFAEGSSEGVTRLLAALIVAYNVAFGVYVAAFIADGLLFAALSSARRARIGGSWSGGGGAAGGGIWGPRPSVPAAVGGALKHAPVRKGGNGGDTGSNTGPGDGEEREGTLALLRRWVVEEAWPRVGHHLRARGSPLPARAAREAAVLSAYLLGLALDPPGPRRSLPSVRAALAARRPQLVRAWNARELLRRGVRFAAWAAHGLVTRETVEDVFHYEARSRVLYELRLACLPARALSEEECVFCL